MYVAILKSKPDTGALREEYRARHDAYWDEHMDRLRLAGPILSDDGQTRTGQILLINADDKATAEKILTSDPFVQAGLFESWTIQRFRVSVEAGRLA